MGGWGGGNDVHVARMFDELFRRYMGVGGGWDNDVHGGDDMLNFHGGSVEVEVVEFPCQSQQA